MKPTKSITEQLPQNVSVAERPKALNTLVAIVDQAIAFRFAERTPSLSDVARLVGVSGRVLHIRDLDERISIENACVMEIARKQSLVN
jgi:hypothetical protein